MEIMKKILLYSFLPLLILMPLISSAQTTSTTIGTCTGEIRTDIVAAQACVDKAVAQGTALGYQMSCKVETVSFLGFVDPNSGKTYYLNGDCTVNGSTGHGAYLLAGFTAAAGSNAIIQSVNPGWDILKTELGYEKAATQCGGAPYGSVVNGVSVYSCTAPAGTIPAQAPLGSTKIAGSTSGTDILTYSRTALLNSLTSLYQKLLSTYKNTYGIDLQSLITGGTTSSGSSTGTGVTNPNSQCYVFTQTLQNNSTGTEVFALTYALKHEGFLTQTTYVFDTTVMVAVKRFQEAHATEILNILGLTQGTGVVGPKTREYLNSKCIVPASVITTEPVTPTTPTACTVPSATAQKTGKYAYTFTKNSSGTYSISLNNPAYSTPSDPYYVPANFSFTAPNALDLNRQNQGKFNYLQSLPGTAAGNTEYANLFGSFNNAYYDWDIMINKLNSTVCPTSTSPIVPPVSTQTATAGTRYIKVSVADWNALPLALREIVVYGPNNTIIKPTTISATNFDVAGYQPPLNLLDGNENTIWRATKTTSTCVDGRSPCEVDGDLQVITLDLGQVYAVSRIAVMNYGLTDTRVFVIEVSTNGSTYAQIAEVRAQANAPIADKSVVNGYVTSASSVGPSFSPSVTPLTTISPVLTSEPNKQCYVFSGFLRLGSTGEDVKALTTQLKKEGFVSEVTAFFDQTVEIGVKRFQEAHAKEILVPNGITQGTGLVFGKTIDYLNSICVDYKTYN